MLNRLLFALLVVNSQASPLLNKDAATDFIILHNNDMHARFDQTSADGGKCTSQDANLSKCYGGFSRIAYEVRQFRSNATKGGTPVIYLNAGDTYTGTPWFTLFKHNITAAFLNKLRPDAISLGNHEFDENIEGLIPFLNNVNFPVLACNLNLARTPEILKTKSFSKSTILDIKDTKVGVIGYLTPETKNLVAPTDIDFYPEVESINKEAELLKENGVNIIIALGHSGYTSDQNIALNCPEVDIVIGGHTNTFLYNGEQPDLENIEGPYPTVITQKSGKHVPVVQAYAYTKYLGKLHVQFDKNGHLLAFDGSPILLNGSVPFEQDLLDLLGIYRPKVTALDKNIIGNTKVYLDGNQKNCRKYECNMGSFVGDAMVYARVCQNKGGTYWTDAAVAFVNAGGIRNSIEKRSDGHVTEADVVSVLPFANALYITAIKGNLIRYALEHSANLRNSENDGAFLQVSGIKVKIDYNRQIGDRITSIQIRCAQCEIPSYEELAEDKTYNVIVTKFLLDGGDGHIFKENEPVLYPLNTTEQDAFTLYIKKKLFVYPGVDGRITQILKSSSDSANITRGTIFLLTCMLAFNILLHMINI